MGYSEICCTLCGVSFNLCRVRTPNEPREYAWDYHGSDKPGSSFTCVDDCFDLNTGCTPANCDDPGQDGCMIEFREDEALQLRGLRGLRGLEKGRGEEEKWEEKVFGGLEGERVDLEEEEERDEDWVPGRTAEAVDEDSEIDFEEMKYYEFENGTEDGREDTSMEDSEDESGTEDQSEYCAWIHKVLTSGPLKIYGYDPNSTDYTKAKLSEKMRCLADEFRVKFPNVVRYPLHVPLDSLEEQLRSEIEEGQHENYTMTQKDGKKVVSLTVNHHSNDLWPVEGCWEHLAGPDCRAAKGYLGSRISHEEMLNCNIAQAILATNSNQTWEPDSNDEDWEGQGKPGWYLTGLVDCMHSRDIGGKEVYPVRHPEIESRFQMDNICWDYGSPMAMAFHPTCLEVFKRVSLKRRGRFDMNALGNWWKTSANYGYMDSIPRASHVSRGRAQWWEHNIGAEYLAADPCFVPPLRKLLASSRRVEGANARARTTDPSSVFSSLPIEIQRSIMLRLDPVDIALLSVVYPDLRAVAQGVLQSSLLQDMPYLWELWCDMPYSQWTKTTAAEIRAGNKVFGEQEQEIARILEILEEEGYYDEHAMYKQYWDENREERRQKSRVSLQEKPAGFVETQKLDLVELVLRLDKARTNGELKGLRNRERIWVDCNYILDRIEELEEEGTIPSS